VRITIEGGRLVDPAHGIDERLDLHLEHGRITALGSRPATFEAQRTIDARGQVVTPGLVDLCARLREPGQEHKATIASETRAAVSAGITTLCVPPDTDPVIDEPSVLELVRRRNEAADSCKIVVLGALTRGLEGELLSEMAALRDAGCVGVSNTLIPIRSTLVMRRAMEYAATYDLTVFLHAADPWLSVAGGVHEGVVATRLGLPGIPACAETVIIARDLALVEEVGVRAHFCRLSTARGVEMVQEAMSRGLPVTADTAAHQLHLTEQDLSDFNSLCHLQPPLRTAADVRALRAAVGSNTITAVCSDHQPHEADAKLNPFSDTEPGISALETLLPLTLELMKYGLTLPQALERLTTGPARVLRLKAGTLAPGAPADICVFDPLAQWELEPEKLVSRGKNTPFGGRTMRGRVTHTLVDGRMVYGSTTMN
jgi:dihydroorotase